MKKTIATFYFLFFILLGKAQILNSMSSYKPQPAILIKENTIAKNMMQVDIFKSNEKDTLKSNLGELRIEKRKIQTTINKAITLKRILSEEEIKLLQTKTIAANEYINTKGGIFEKNDSINFVNNTKIDNSIWLVDSFLNKTVDKKTRLVDEIIEVKYQAKKRNEALKDYKDQFDYIQLVVDTINMITSFTKQEVKIKELFIDLDIEKKQLETTEKNFTIAHQKVVAALKGFTEKNITNSSTKQSDDKQAINLNNNFLNDLVITPTLSLLGSNHLDDNYTYKETGLSIGLVSDKIAQNNLFFFYSDLSTFKIFTRYNVAFKRLDSIVKNNTRGVFSFNAEASFLGKKYFTDTSKTKDTHNTTMFFLRTGVEGTLISNLMSAYANIRAFAPISGFESFRNYKNTNKSIYATIDFGFNFLLKPTLKRNDGLNVLVNLNFLTNSNDVQSFTNFDGLLIPSVRIGVSQNLNLFGKNSTASNN
jgi:hypothetical protein